jgi:hypothetical protein
VPRQSVVTTGSPLAMASSTGMPQASYLWWQVRVAARARVRACVRVWRGNVLRLPHTHAISPDGGAGQASLAAARDQGVSAACAHQPTKP